ncbi:MAG: hypothetical protein M1826_004745 [Phylliscum demangeonii]|nr:MAG: hypothetical protein M1826_004745 [Phylliscum demangeonii]
MNLPPPAAHPMPLPSPASSSARTPSHVSGSSDWTERFDDMHIMDERVLEHGPDRASASGGAGGRSSKVTSKTQVVDISAKGSKKTSDRHFKGVTLRRAEAEPGTRRTWIRAVREDMHLPQAELLKQVNDHRRRGVNLYNQLEKLRAPSQGQVRRLVEDENAQEANRQYTWELAYIGIEKKSRGWGNQPETSRISVILERTTKDPKDAKDAKDRDPAAHAHAHAHGPGLAPSFGSGPLRPNHAADPHAAAHAGLNRGPGLPASHGGPPPPPPGPARPQMMSSHGHPMPPPGVHGHPMPPPGAHGHPMPPPGAHGHPRPPPGAHGHPMPPPGAHGHPMPPQAAHGHPMPPQAAYGHPMPPQAAHGPPMPPQAAHGNPMHPPHANLAGAGAGAGMPHPEPGMPPGFRGDPHAGGAPMRVAPQGMPMGQPPGSRPGMPPGMPPGMGMPMSMPMPMQMPPAPHAPQVMQAGRARRPDTYPIDASMLAGAGRAAKLPHKGPVNNARVKDWVDGDMGSDESEASFDTDVSSATTNPTSHSSSNANAHARSPRLARVESKRSGGHVRRPSAASSGGAGAAPRRHLGRSTSTYRDPHARRRSSDSSTRGPRYHGDEDDDDNDELELVDEYDVRPSRAPSDRRRRDSLGRGDRMRERERERDRGRDFGALQRATSVRDDRFSDRARLSITTGRSSRDRDRDYERERVLDDLMLEKEYAREEAVRREKDRLLLRERQRRDDQEAAAAYHRARRASPDAGYAGYAGYAPRDYSPPRSLYPARAGVGGGVAIGTGMGVRAGRYEYRY